MIKFENTNVYGWDAAIRGMRNPMNSWDKSDSYYTCEHSGFPCQKCLDYNGCKRKVDYHIGDNDHKLMMSLAKNGPVHGKYRRAIIVSVDITAPLYWWKEFDTYKVGTVANSCSTMHKIHAKEFTLEDFSCERILPEIGNARWYNMPMVTFESVIHSLNVARDIYNEARADGNKILAKGAWDTMIQLLPSSYNQMRTITMNYEVLANIYCSRYDHKLDEWRIGFMDWIKSLPYSEIITAEMEE